MFCSAHRTHTYKLTFHSHTTYIQPHSFHVILFNINLVQYKVALIMLQGGGVDEEMIKARLESLHLSQEDEPCAWVEVGGTTGV